MKLVEMNCPSCGADLKLDADNARAVCEYCGAEVLVDSGARRDPEQEGYEFEKGRQRAMAEAGYYPQHKRRTWLWVLGWIFIFPVPLSIIVARSGMKPWQKAAVIILAWAAYLGLAYLGKESDKKKTQAPTSPASSSVAAPESSGA